jgi:MFS family permease
MAITAETRQRRASKFFNAHRPRQPALEDHFDMNEVAKVGWWRLAAALAAAGFGGSLVLLSFSHSFSLSAGVMLLIGFTMVIQLDASNTLVQRIVPDEMRGRVMAIWTMMLTGLAPFGSLLVGVLAQHFTARRTFAAGGLACVMGAMAFGFSLPILQREARKLITKRGREDSRLVLKTKNRGS